LPRRRALDNLYDLISGDEDARVCKDIPEEACQEVPANFFLQLSSQLATKLGDALSDPKLVLTWLLTTLGAPAAAVGALVPVREAGSLLPQLAIGGVVRRHPVRKWFWVGGSLVQALAVLLMALVALLDPAPAAGWLVVLLTALFSVGRAVCSVSAKDLLGKTVPRTRRGRLGGLAATGAGAITLVVGLAFATRGPEGLGPRQIALLLLAASSLWLLATVLMALLREVPGATSGAGHALQEAVRSLGLLRSDRAFRNFCVARALLASTVLSMPFVVLLAREASGGRLASLGLLLVASSSATMISASVWGWMADRSSRRTMAVAGLLAGVVGCAVHVLAGRIPGETAAIWIYGILFFLLGLAHTGIRLGRKTYLVDMAPSERRASYVAVSNTLIGLVLVLSGGFGLLEPSIGARGVVLVFALLGLAGGALALALREVED
jgi:MFS family permease